MGKNSFSHPPVKLLTGFIFKESSYFDQAQELLCKEFGEMDFQSPILPFDHSTYYCKELGNGLKRKFVCFKRLISPGILPDIKIFSNHLEEKFSFNSNRCINIDPGYLTLAKLVLASTKDYAHRIYLGQEIFAEITLCYKGKSFVPLSWAYPDYQNAACINIFNHMRALYYQQTILRQN